MPRSSLLRPSPPPVVYPGSEIMLSGASTGSEAGLDPVTYTVYAVDAPVGRSDLPGHSYMTVAVTLGQPPEIPVPGAVAPLTTAPAEPEAPAMPTATPGATPTTTAPVSALVACRAVFLAAAILSRR